ncbi:MAG: hypothetical protein OER88_08385, partial [Planctomycetota bacterium]|nr:hypothetical protein [Planctomycetota bacterium]
MSSMAKIFVVVNLVLAVCTFGAAATLLGAQDDYKEANVAMKTKFEAFQAAKAADISSLKDQVAQQTQRSGQAIVEQKNAQQESESYKTQLANARTSAEKLQSSVQVYAAEIAALRKQMADNVADIKKMSDASQKATQDAVNARQTLEDEVANRARLEGEVSKLSDTIQQLSAQKGDLERQIRQAKFEIGEYAKKHG